MSIEIYSGIPTEELDDGRPWPDGWIKKIFKRPSAAASSSSASPSCDNNNNNNTTTGGGGNNKKNSDSFWYTPIKKYKLRSMKETKRFIKLLEGDVCNGDEDLTIDTMKKQKMIRYSSSQTSRRRNNNNNNKKIIIFEEEKEKEMIIQQQQKGGNKRYSRTTTKQQQQQQQPVSILASQKTSSSKKKRQSTTNNNKKKVQQDDNESSSSSSLEQSIIDSIEEEDQLYATNEIKRLLKQAMEDYQTLFMDGIRKGTCYPNVDLVDPNNDIKSLNQTINLIKGGSIQLLNLIQINLCDGPLCFGKSDYEKRLGMFFFRHHRDDTTDSSSNTKINKSKRHPPSTFDTNNNDDDDNGSSSSSDDDNDDYSSSSSSSSDDDDDDDYNVDVISESRMICCRCVARNFDIRERVCCTGEWTADQAERILFNIPKLCQQLECNSQYYELYHRGEPWMNSVNTSTTTSSDDGDDTNNDGIELYSPWTVTMTALTMSSIWNLHYVLLGNINEYNNNTYDDEDEDDDGLIIMDDDNDEPTPPTRRKKQQQQQQQQSSKPKKRSKHVCKKCGEPSCRRPFRRGGPCGS